jgi:hypothetical protein
MAHRVTLIPGDGIGPELAEATCRVLDATGIGFEWETVEAGEAAIVGESSTHYTKAPSVGGVPDRAARGDQTAARLAAYRKMGRPGKHSDGFFQHRKHAVEN